MENPIEMDDLGVPLFSEASIWKFLKILVHNNHEFFLLKMIKTWGVKWGYHHLRKHLNRTALQ